MTAPACHDLQRIGGNDIERIPIAAGGNGSFQFLFFRRLGLVLRRRFNELDRVPAEKIAAGRALGDRFFDLPDTADKPKVGHGKKAIVFLSAKMQRVELSRRHFDLAFTNNLERQIEIESGNGATVFPFGAEAQIPGQDGNWGIKSFRISAFTAMSGYQDRLAVVFEKLTRMYHAIDCSFDPQGILFVRISGSKDLARQCLRLGLTLAGQSVLPGGSICGWNWPFRLCDRCADHDAQ